MRKKVVEIPDGELTWAKEPGDVSGLPTIYVTGEPGSGPSTSRQPFSRVEAEHTRPLIEQYAAAGVPRDRLLVLD